MGAKAVERHLAGLRLLSADGSRSLSRDNRHLLRRAEARLCT
jgi:hypothetical protein